MLIHQLKIALRALLRAPLYAGINIVSLAVGMAATVLIGLWVQQEWYFDRHYRLAPRIWRITADLPMGESDTWYWGSTPLRIAELAAQVPGVAGSAQLKFVPQLELALWRGQQAFLGKNPMWISDNWFSFFDHELKQGSLEAFFRQPNGLLLTEKKAQEIFGNQPAVGQMLRIDSLDHEVCGILANPSSQSSFQYEIVLPIAAGLRNPAERDNANSWGNFNYTTFLELQPQTDPEAVGQQLTRLFREARGTDTSTVLGLQPLAAMHFDTRYQDDFRKGNHATTRIFALIGLLLLGMACVNYVSLTTARAATRAREIGIKKINGAHSGHIFGQIMSESTLLVLLAAGLAAVLVNLSMPLFNQLTETVYDFRWEKMVLGLFGGVLGLTLLLSGWYPAWLLSRFQPLSLTRNVQTNGQSRFRKGLVVFQFAMSSALLLSAMVIWQQYRYIQEKPVGYDRNNVFSFQMTWQVWQKMGRPSALVIRDRMRQMLEGEASVAGVTISSGTPVHLENTHSGSIRHNGLAENQQPTVTQLSADANFANLFNLQLAEGRWFEPASEADENHVILNETAARKLNLPQPWLGQRFGFQGKEGMVIGILRDFHFESLHTPIGPLVVHHAPDWGFYFFVKAQDGRLPQALAAAEAAWAGNFPNHPFRYKLLDESFNQLYGAERRAGLLFNVFAAIAILISCMGLFGLAVFMAGQRTKEIGIRKVLGASVASVVGLLSKDFLKLVLISILIASPVAYYLMQRWLSDFAYRIDIQWWIFVAAGALAVLIAFLTVGFQSVRAALADPVKSLRSE